MSLFRTALRMQKNFIDPMKVAGSNELFWELEANKRITISEFKHNIYIHIRQFECPEGKDYLVPTKKGIALNIEQFEKLKQVIHSVDLTLKDKVANMEPRPVDQ